jgi:hydantoinase/carbamoylase family amidase
MPISSERIANDIAKIGKLTETPDTGTINRTPFSVPWGQARDYVVGELEALGCKIRVDSAGNVHARPTAISWEAAAWLSGSHLDTIPNGGNYDGVIGVIAVLEAMRAAREDLKIAVPLELVIWAATEPAFGMAMIGSRSYVAELNAHTLAELRNARGLTYTQAGAPFGVDPAKLAGDKLKKSTIIGYVEVHAEEGLTMWGQGLQVACVTNISGRRQYRCELVGAPNHAGSTAMHDRRDALTGAAEMIVSLEKLALELRKETVITVGRIECEPNMMNFIAGKVTFTIDLRSPSTTVLAQADQAIQKLFVKVAKQRKLQHKIELTDSRAGIDFDQRICSKMHKAARAKRIEPMIDMTSGAIHDAAVLAEHIPSAMLFVPSRDGISHSPEEYSRPDDIAAAVTVLLETVRDRRLE